MGRLIIFSGAGISAESGIPTFRDGGGLWEKHDINEVCNIYTFISNYNVVHSFYNDRRAELENVEPNKAHLKIAEVSKQLNVVNVTTNIDDLFQRAGCDNVIHLHGELTKVIPKFNGETNEHAIDVGYQKLSDKYLDDNHPVKPAVTFFYETAPEYQKLNDLVYSITPQDTVIVVGSSENVVCFTQTLMLGSSMNWEQMEASMRPRFIFVNPDKNIVLPDIFERYACGAVEYFTSKSFEKIAGYHQALIQKDNGNV